MENKPFKGAFNLRPFLFFLFFTLYLGALQAQNASKYYTSQKQDEGTLYFITPRKSFLNKKAKQKLDYELTHLTSKDSITLNFTFLDRAPRSIDSIRIKSVSKDISSATEKFYVEAKRKKWLHRYSTEFNLKDFKHVLESSKHPEIEVFYDGKSAVLQMKRRKWRKEQAIILKVLDVVEQNS